MTENLENLTSENVDDAQLNDLPEELSEEELADLMSRSIPEPPAPLQNEHPADQLSEAAYNEKLKQVRKWIWTALAGVLLLVVVILGVGLWDALVATPNQPIVTIGAEEITVKMYQTRVRYLRFQLLEESVRIQLLLSTMREENSDTTQLEQSLQQLNYLLMTPDALGTSAMNSLLEDFILINKADTLGIVITNENVDAAFYDKFRNSSEHPESYTDAQYTLDYAEYIRKRATADLTEEDIREMRRIIVIRDMVTVAITAEEGDDEEARTAAFNEWLSNERAKLVDQMAFDDELMERSTPEEPKLTDPEVFEALFGFTIQEYQATLSAQTVEE